MAVAQGIVDFVRGFGERKRVADTRSAMKNYLSNPEAAIAEVNQIDPYQGIALQNQFTKTNNEATDRATATADATQKRQLGAFTQVTTFLRSARDGGQTDMGAALDSLSPFIKSTLGADDAQIAEWKGALAQNPGLLDSLDEEGQKARAKLSGDVRVVGPGAGLAVGGKVVYSQPNAPKVMAVPNETGGRDVITVDPNNPGIGTPGTGTGVGRLPAMTVDALRPAFVAQESGGNYAAKNAETGALGAYQVMPQTGAALAKRLGMPWRPDMMQGTDQASRNYQDAIGGAAIKEAVDASGGDPREVFSYYYGGSNKKNWGPKTGKYAEEMMARVGGGDPTSPGGARPVYSTQGKPTADKSVRAATPEEISAGGYPAGTAAQIDANGKLVNLRTPAAGPAAKLKVAPAEVRTRAEGALSQMQRLKIAAQRILDDPNFDGATGTIQGAVPSIFQGSVDFDNNLTSLKDKLVIDTIQTMKAMSATGATGFGSLTEKEGTRLENFQGSLNQRSPKVLRQSLKDIVAFADEKIGALKKGLDTGADGTGAPGAPAVGTEFRNPKTGARVRWNGQGWAPVR